MSLQIICCVIKHMYDLYDLKSALVLILMTFACLDVIIVMYLSENDVCGVL